MGEYRHIETGEIKTQGAWRNHYKKLTSLPKSWTAATLDGLKLEPIFETPRPEAGEYQNAIQSGVEKDIKGNWVWVWEIRDMFSDYTDEDGTLITKAEQEAAYQARLDAGVSDDIRKKRNTLLADSDWTQISDAPVDATAWATYRQALRDITNHVNFPYLADEDWPAKPI